MHSDSNKNLLLGKLNIRKTEVNVKKKNREKDHKIGSKALGRIAGNDYGVEICGSERLTGVLLDQLTH